MVLGSGIREPEQTHSGSRIQGSKRHRIPDPGSVSATLVDSDSFFYLVSVGTTAEPGKELGKEGGGIRVPVY
jgi:hypothetical protein